MDIHGIPNNPKLEYAQNVSHPIGIRNGLVSRTNYFRHGLEIGWEIARQKKLPPKPCLVCGKPVYYKTSTKDRAKYCSNACKYIGLKGRTHKSTKPKSGESFICKTCGNEFYQTPSEIKRSRTNYCSINCRKLGGYNPYCKGDKAPAWKGGRCRCQGYIYIKSYSHPYRNSSDYVLEHRLVMEKYLGRYLTNNEEVHHRNGIKTDNRIENLEIVIKKAHNGHVSCPYCNKEFAIK